MSDAGAVYIGEVVHKRLRPTPHALAYRVFSVDVDVDRLDELDRQCRWFSYNRRNWISLYDKDFGAGDGRSLAQHARHTFASAGFETRAAEIRLLAYPRLLGYAFNPLSVFFLFAATGELAAVAYEVSNTFGERRVYVLAAGSQTNGVYAQTCRKELFVSPFAPRQGRYLFRLAPQAETMAVGVAYSDPTGPLIKTHFRGHRAPFNDATLRALMIRMPLMTFKVITAIHYEALKLFMKRVPLVSGHRSAAYSASYVRQPARTERTSS